MSCRYTVISSGQCSTLYCIALHCIACIVVATSREMASTQSIVSFAQQEKRKYNVKSRYPSTQVHTALTLLLLFAACMQAVWDINQCFSSGIFFVFCSSNQSGDSSVARGGQNGNHPNQPRFSQNLAINLLINMKYIQNSIIILSYFWLQTAKN